MKKCGKCAAQYEGEAQLCPMCLESFGPGESLQTAFNQLSFALLFALAACVVTAFASWIYAPGDIPYFYAVSVGLASVAAAFLSFVWSALYLNRGLSGPDIRGAAVRCAFSVLIVNSLHAALAWCAAAWPLLHWAFHDAQQTAVAS